MRNLGNSIGDHNNFYHKFNMLKKIDIGCGKNKKEGFIGIDRLDYGQEIIVDIEQGLPIEDDSVDEINCSHTIEHLDDLKGFFKEVKRILKIGGKAFFTAPHRSHIWSACRGHIRLIDEDYVRQAVKDFKLNLLDVHLYNCNDYGLGVEISFEIEKI